MTLAELNQGESGRIVRVGDVGSIRRHIVDGSCRRHQRDGSEGRPAVIHRVKSRLQLDTPQGGRGDPIEAQTSRRRKIAWGSCITRAHERAKASPESEAPAVTNRSAMRALLPPGRRPALSAFLALGGNSPQAVRNGHRSRRTSDGSECATRPPDAARRRRAICNRTRNGTAYLGDAMLITVETQVNCKEYQGLSSLISFFLTNC